MAGAETGAHLLSVSGDLPLSAPVQIEAARAGGEKYKLRQHRPATNTDNVSSSSDCNIYITFNLAQLQTPTI